MHAETQPYADTDMMQLHLDEISRNDADADPFMLHLFAALAEKERAVIPQRMA